MLRSSDSNPTKRRFDKMGFEGDIILFENEPDVLRRLAGSITEGVILEIGAYLGGSSCIMAEVSQVPMFSVDMWDLWYPQDYRLVKKRFKGLEKGRADLYKKFLANVSRLGLTEKITPINAPSREIAKVWEKPIGLLFIDGDHSYEGCKADYEGFAKHIIPGGYLVVHDYDRKHVKRCVNEIKDGWTGFTVEGRTAVLRKRE